MAQHETSILTTFAGHWRGSARLLPVILLNIVGVGLVLILLLVWAEGSAEWQVFGLATLCCVLVPIWQSVGLFRTCNRHVRETGDNMLPWAGYLILTAILMATASQAIGSVLSLDRFQAPPEVAEVPLVLPISEDGRIVRIEGEIDYHVLAALSEALSRHQALKTVTLESDGGLIYAARAIAGVVLEHGLDTHVPNRCASACTLIFAAGQARTLGERGRVGFHAYGKLTPHHILMVDAGEEQAKDVRFLLERGISEAFLQDIYLAGKDDMWFPDRAALKASGLLTDGK